METFVALLRGINVSGRKKIRMADLAADLMQAKNGNEHYLIEGRFIFLYYPDGYGQARMNNNAFEKALNVAATTRNWRTINRLYELAAK